MFAHPGGGGRGFLQAQGWGPCSESGMGRAKERATASSQVADPDQELKADCVSQRIARKMVHDQGVLPIVDAVKIDADNNVIDTLSKPLLPIVPHGDSKRFFALMEQLTSWMREERAFWSV